MQDRRTRFVQHLYNGARFVRLVYKSCTNGNDSCTSLVQMATTRVQVCTIILVQYNSDTCTRRLLYNDLYNSVRLVYDVESANVDGFLQTLGGWLLRNNRFAVDSEHVVTEDGKPTFIIIKATKKALPV